MERVKREKNIDERKILCYKTLSSYAKEEKIHRHEM